MQMALIYGLIAGLGVYCIILSLRVKLLEEQIKAIDGWRRIAHNVINEMNQQLKQSVYLFNQIDDLNQLTVKRLNMMQDYIFSEYNETNSSVGAVENGANENNKDVESVEEATEL